MGEKRNTQRVFRDRILKTKASKAGNCRFSDSARPSQAASRRERYGSRRRGKQFETVRTYKAPPVAHVK